MRRRYNPVFPHEAGFAPTWRGRVPHSTAAEQRMLYDWLDTLKIQPEMLWYDVAFDGVPGDGPPLSRFPAGTPANYARMWQRLNSKRADAVAQWPGGYQLVELRPDAKPQTVGEIHAYRYLAASEWPALQWLKPLVITINIDPMIEATILASDIELVKLYAMPDGDATPVFADTL